MKNDLNKLREQIDTIDKQLITLLSQRLDICHKIGEAKRKIEHPILDEKRFQKVMKSAKKFGNNLGVEENFIEQIYEIIHQYALKVEQKEKTNNVFGIQGGKGSFNDEAIHYYTKQISVKEYKIKYLYTTENVLQALKTERIDKGQFAIHNTLGGVVEESIQAMGRYNFNIIDKYKIKITHALMIRNDAELSDVDTIMTHPQVLAQCKKTLDQKYPNLKRISGEKELIDHALVAKYLAEGKLPKNIATMGSKILAKTNKLKVIENNMQDSNQNYTTFLQVIKP